MRNRETLDDAKREELCDAIRVLDPERLKNLVALVLAAASFAAVWLGEGMRLAVLRRIVTRLSRRFFGVHAFHYYALADAIRTILARSGCWPPSTEDLAPSQPPLRQRTLF